MGTDLVKPGASSARRYEAVLRLSEALSICREPEELTKTLAQQLGEFLDFFQFYIIVYKSDSTEVEWAVLGSEKSLISAYADVPIKDRPSWRAYTTQEPFYIADWNTDERVPAKLKAGLTVQGLKIGPLVFVPLTTPHRRLGALGMSGFPGTAYTADDIIFFQLIGRVVAFAIDDNFNVRQAELARAELERQNDRLRLLLKLTNQITSKLQLRELLCAISANIREVMHGDAVHISLRDEESGEFRVYALDFPQGKGFVKEEMVVEPVGAVKRALEKLASTVRSVDDRDEFPPDYYESLVAEGVKRQCVIPLVNKGRAIGVLAIARTSDDSFQPEEIQFLGEASGQIAIAIENSLAYGQISELKDKLAQEKLYLEEEIRGGMDFDQIVGNSPALRQVLKLVETVAPSDSTVLLLGETGTGKELIARALHEHSRRKERIFVKVNCAAIPTGLLESELFGHERGAFTGAISQKPGD